MKNHKRLLALALAFVLALSMSVPASAAVEDTGFSDVAAGAWYAEAAAYVWDNGLMGGTSATAFSPERTMTRAMLAVVLYRMEGTPAVSGTDTFTDTAEGAWYSDAVLWVSQEGLIGGYGNGLFGAGDPVTREQIATILWRYAGSPAAERGADFADESSISAYAADGVDWARASGVINGKGNNRFDPQGNATRAEVATVLINYIQGARPVPAPDPAPSPGPDGAKILIAYFTVPESSGVDAVAQASRVVENGEVMGNVEFIANTIQEETGGDVFAIETVQTYPGEHQALLDFAAAEMAANARPALSSSISNLDDYDVIFIGYPIWWDEAPAMIATFLAENDFSGKVIAPFCTSSYSSIDNSLHIFQELAAGAAIADGLTANNQDSIRPWADQVMSQAVRGETRGKPRI